MKEQCSVPGSQCSGPEGIPSPEFASLTLPLSLPEGEGSQVWQQDCISGMAERLEAESMDLCVTSIPFGSLFCYSGKEEDLGNNVDGIDMRESMFALHLRFFAEQLLRVMKPGRNACIHIQQLLRFQNTHGHAGRRDFRGAIVDIFESAGFHWKGEFVIPKNPQVVAQRLKLHSLLFVTGRTDSVDLAPAPNDFIMILQKPGENAAPVRALWDRKRNPDGWVSTNEWIRWARGCWMDVNGVFGEDSEKLVGYDEACEIIAQMETEYSLLSGVWTDIKEGDVLDNWQHGRQDSDEKHVCPLQLEVIRRLIKLYSNAGEKVVDPFGGIGSTGYVAEEQGRTAYLFELKESYAALALRNTRSGAGSGATTLDFGDEALPSSELSEGARGLGVAALPVAALSQEEVLEGESV